MDYESVDPEDQWQEGVLTLEIRAEEEGGSAYKYDGHAAATDSHSPSPPFPSLLSLSISPMIAG